jgi:hypothetical protein
LFFFEKKKINLSLAALKKGSKFLSVPAQSLPPWVRISAKRAKVFCFFFSKKKTFRRCKFHLHAAASFG